MVFRVDAAGDLLWGPLLDRHAALPLRLWAILPDLRPRFLPKGPVGRGHRAIARNGRVLLASNRPLAELAGQMVQVRFQPWHRVLLPGDPPTLYGLLMCVRLGPRPDSLPGLFARFVTRPEDCCELALPVGGEQVLAFMGAEPSR